MNNPLITIFSAPKGFSDPHIATIQRNAIQSWLHLGPEVEVFLVGQETGFEEVSKEYGVQLLTDVRRNSSGTPLVSSIFSLARQASSSPILIYTNGDMLFLPDIITACRQVTQLVKDYLIIGQRWDLDVPQLLDFSTVGSTDNNWDSRLRQEVRRRGELHLPAGSDYFIFPRHLFLDVPDFAIGRAGWDNWMIYQARQKGWMVIDGTPSIMAIHQSHDYGHLPGGKPHYMLPESDQNAAMAGGSTHLFMILDSHKQLRDGKLKPPPLTLVRLLRHLEVRLTPLDGKKKGPRWSAARQFRRWRRRLTGSLQ
jgi:hypothetical protein